MKIFPIKIAQNMLLISGILLGLAGNANAGSCGKGYITEVSEGAHSQAGLMIKIDYSRGNSAHPGTETYQYILYPESMAENKLRAIRSMAMIALVSGVAVNNLESQWEL